MEMTRNKYRTKREVRILRKRISEYDSKDLYELLIGLTRLENASFKYIKERDNNTCRFCGSVEDLQVHHLTPRALGGDNHEDNLICLCSGCHGFLHLNPFGKMKKSELIKKRIIKEGNITLSHKGNKWGYHTVGQDAI
jgi:hypothetical protein